MNDFARIIFKQAITTSGCYFIAAMTFKNIGGLSFDEVFTMQNHVWFLFLFIVYVVRDLFFDKNWVRK